MTKKQNKTINSESVEYMKTLLHPSVKIADLTVKGKWLCALLDNGIYFSVLNNI